MHESATEPTRRLCFGRPSGVNYPMAPYSLCNRIRTLSAADVDRLHGSVSAPELLHVRHLAEVNGIRPKSLRMTQ